MRFALALALAAALLYGAWGPLQFPVTLDTTWGTTGYVQTRSMVGDSFYPSQVDLFGHTVLSRREERDAQSGVTVVRERTLNHFALGLSVCATVIALVVAFWGLSGLGSQERKSRPQASS
jgi:hypothetical protein